MFDLVIRGGSVIDGSGAPRRSADVAVQGDRIAEVGRVDSRGQREIRADGLLVAPGLVDVHTHYDGQVAWDPLLTPSSWHGVTTVVMGNCGVGFAPASPDRHEFLIRLMEGVEDIPGAVLAEALSWKWESFPEYLDAIDCVPHAIDFGAQLPHGALRTYVMGERGADHAERPSPAEIARMAQLAREAIEAGALGFSTSRTVNHRARGGAPTPSLTASAEELVGIARGVGAAGQGVLQGISDFFELEAEFGLLRRMAAESGRPLSFTVLQNPAQPGRWREVLELTAQAVQQGVSMCGQVATRAIGMMLGLHSGRHPFATCASYQPLAGLPVEERVARMREPRLRSAILAELRAGDPRGAFLANFVNLYELGDPPDYEPGPERSLEARARAEGRDAAELTYDLLLARGGRTLLYAPVMNYVSGNLDATREMLLHPHTIPGLGDAGAHVGLICDGSFPTTLLSHWSRDRIRGERLPLEWLIKRQARDTAEWVGLCDRGLVAPGMKADLNLIDFERLGTCEPEMAFDLPTGARRLVQRARGYRMTLVSGQVVMQDGEHTGALPGRLVRGAQPPPG